MGERLPQPTAHLIKRARRLARKLDALAPRQSAAPVAVPAVVLRAITNVLWQLAGRLDDSPWDHNGECLHCDGLGEHEADCPWAQPRDRKGADE